MIAICLSCVLFYLFQICLLLTYCLFLWVLFWICLLNGKKMSKHFCKWTLFCCNLSVYALFMCVYLVLPSCVSAWFICNNSLYVCLTFKFIQLSFFSDMCTNWFCSYLLFNMLSVICLWYQITVWKTTMPQQSILNNPTYASSLVLSEVSEQGVEGGMMMFCII